MKKKLSFLLIAAMLLSIFTVLPASAAENSDPDIGIASVGATSGEYDYVVESYSGGEKHAVITDCRLSGNVTLPEKIDGYNVTEVRWSDNQRSFATVTVPDSIDNMEGSFNSPNLTSVVFKGLCNIDPAGNLTESKGNVFGNCPKLTKVTFSEYYHNSNGVIWCDNMDYVTVVGCLGGATAVSIPDDTVIMCPKAFMGCHKLAAVNIPISYKVIEQDTFLNCENLKEINIANKYTIIEKHGVGYCLTAEGSYEKVDGVVIRGYAGSNAQTYAEENGFIFKEITAEAPAITLLEAVSQGVRLSWKAVEGYSRYTVFYNDDDGSWNRLATVNGTSFTDTTVKNGTRRNYTVRAADTYGNPVGKYNMEGWEISYFSAPKIELITNSRDSNGAAVYVPIANLYDGYNLSDRFEYVLYRYADSKWEEVTSKDEETGHMLFIDNKVKNGKKYTYKVRVRNIDTGYFVSPDSPSKTVTFYTAPKISSMVNVVKGTKLTWTKISGAAKYRVFYKNDFKDSPTGWKTLATVSGTTYTDTAVKNAIYKKYTVRAIDSKGKFIGGYVNSVNFYSDNAWLQLFFPPVTVGSLTNTKEGVKLTVSYPYGRYPASIIIYRKSGGSSYKAIGVIGGASTYDDIPTYIDRTVAAGIKYTYAVRAQLGFDNSIQPVSAYIGGKSIKATQVQYPAITGFSNRTNGVTLTWNRYPGAAKYAVFHKVSGKWKRLATIAANSYTDTSVAAAAKASGISNTAYTVRAINKSGKYISTYYSAGWPYLYTVAPKISSAAKVSNGVKLSWKGVGKAVSYRIYRKTGSGAWKQITTVQAKGTVQKIGGEWVDNNSYTYTDKTAQKGSKYTYTVRAEYRYTDGYRCDCYTLTSYYSGKSITL